MQAALPKALDDRPATHARRLLVGDRGEDDLAGQRHAGGVQGLEGDDESRQATLHVVGAAPEQKAVALRRHERVAGPLLARLDIDGVDVAGEQQAARRHAGGVAGVVCAATGSARGYGVASGAHTPTGAARQAGDELRPPDEVEVGRHELSAGARRPRLPEVDLGAQGVEARRQQALQLRFFAGRLARVAGGRVESNERTRQAHELAAHGPHRLDDPPLQLARRAAGLRSHAHDATAHQRIAVTAAAAQKSTSASTVTHSSTA